MTAAEDQGAHRQARGNVLRRPRTAWLGSWDTWSRDLRLAGRGLRHAPGFAIAAVLTLAVGMAGAITMFALIEGVVLRPLPVPDEAQLFVGWRALPEAGARHWPLRPAHLDLLRRESRLLEGVAGVGYNDPGPMPAVEGGTATFYPGSPCHRGVLSCARCQTHPWPRADVPGRRRRRGKRAGHRARPVAAAIRRIARRAWPARGPERATPQDRGCDAAGRRLPPARSEAGR